MNPILLFCYIAMAGLGCLVCGFVAAIIASIWKIAHFATLALLSGDGEPATKAPRPRWDRRPVANFFWPVVLMVRFLKYFFTDESQPFFVDELLKRRAKQ